MPGVGKGAGLAMGAAGGAWLVRPSERGSAGECVATSGGSGIGQGVLCFEKGLRFIVGSGFHKVKGSI